MNKISVATTAVVVICAPAFGRGPEWVEQGDAGSLPNGAQVVSGSGGLGKISGALEGSVNFDGTGDFEDMYLIYIDDPQNFSATTTFLNGGSADFDSQMWLFMPNGLGLLGNDDTFVIGEGNGTVLPGSTLGPKSTDGTGIMITEPGLYFLAISGKFEVPISPEGFICAFASPTEISGPDGAGGGQPISAWNNTSLNFGGALGQTGAYSIALTGTSLVPAPSGVVALLIGAAGWPRRTRRR